MAEPRHGRRPLVIEEVPGKKAHCMCGLAANLPYCDGAHSRQGTAIRPCVVEVTEAGPKAVCQCHQSATLPLCDGTHSRLE